MRRGELYWARLPQPVGRRPVLIVSRDATLAVRSRVTVAPITRTIRGIRSEVALGRSHGLRAASVANCDSLQTILKEALGPGPIGELPVPELVALDRAIRFALGIRK
ncbi:MAG: type II toxin-antitoxin system PemK/MazF family toxin [Actinomycetota bacterium]